MDVLDNLILGAQVAFSWQNVLYCLIGVLLGTLIGVLPGIGPVPTIAMLLPITFNLDPIAALIMLSGIYYGSQYGGSTTAILVNLPGEAASVVTVLDGHQMARQGRAGPALAISAIGSFVAGCIATLVIATAAPPLAEVALKFGPAEYFSLMVLGLVAATVLAHGSLVKAIAMVVLGLLLGLAGTDVNSGVLRFTFGVPELADGIGFVIVAMGMFGVTEIVANLEQRSKREVFVGKVTHLFPTKEDLKRSWAPILRGTALGSFLGILPGGGALLSSFASYTVEKKVSKHPEQFGKGAIEGVAGPESANNAGAQTSFIPMLTLGIPGNAVMALMIGALMIQGIAPGPQVMTDKPELFWGLIASMWLGNAMLVVLNLPLIGIWIKLLQVPYRFLFPAILIFMNVGVFSLSNNPWDCLIMSVFGVFGYICVKLECEPAPMILGFILGPLMEENLRRAMLLSRGDPTVFFDPVNKPISFSFLLAALALLVIIALPNIRKKREEVFVEET
ncbi:MAG: tripartite tricarboxylate transporter permease [Betaproteobacteria bacterium]|nr:tripartite tricarboxylate transporter permease [Betaproteobacteria bacterium]MDH4322595.1 tripartite tricarboxylate transporter permease [Betaproteobacteria bacterium]MDH5576838.1 tripartite tricarboxylate transporter permease [Betaproteobacteria bacterium]